MLNADFIRENSEKVRKGILKKGADPAFVDDFIKIDGRWRELVGGVDNLRAEQKELSRERKINEARENKEKVKQMEAELKDAESKRIKIWKMIPNLPGDDTPEGKGEDENVVIREVGKKTEFDFTPKDYIHISQELQLIDIERASKVSGSRFGYLLGDLPRLEFALGQLVFDIVTDKKLIKKIARRVNASVSDRAFKPVVPPVLVNEDSMRGMGYVERGEEEIYKIEKDNLYLVGTSEQSIGPMHSGETFSAQELPVRYVGFSTCFRREAGSYGKDTKGILRVHQFDKFEMFSFTSPDSSGDEHKLLLAIEEHIMEKLELSYRVVNICSGDLGDPASSKFDIEAWMPGQNGGKGEYRETHSTSNTTDYQARRLNIRFNKPDNGGSREFVHMLNGTAVAVGRMLIAIIENYQNEDGSVQIPKVLQSYVGKKKITAN